MTKQSFTILLGVCALFGGVILFGRIRAADKDRAFDRFFESRPTSVEVLAYGYDRSIFGDGSYVLTFRIPHPEIHGFLKENGYTPTPIDSDPNHWRISLCNEVVGRLAVAGADIQPTFECYSHQTQTNQARVFYDTSNRVAIVVGFGKYAK